jgi:hypothetical protein
VVVVLVELLPVAPPQPAEMRLRAMAAQVMAVERKMETVFMGAPVLLRAFPLSGVAAAFRDYRTVVSPRISSRRV